LDVDATTCRAQLDASTGAITVASIRASMGAGIGASISAMTNRVAPRVAIAPRAASSRRARKLVRGVARLVVWTACIALTLWSAAALYFDAPTPGTRAVLALGYAACMAVVLVRVKPRALAQLACLGSFALVLAWWLSIAPSNDRDWQPDVAVLPRIDVDGSKVTIHGIRDCEYRSETDFDVHSYDKTFDLDKLETVDLFLVHWGSPAIAHTMVSFGFAGGGYVCISIETRKEKGESYSALRGFFRQYELIYVVADERDLVRLRTNYRHEDVSLYRVKCTPATARAFFLEYAERIRSLSTKPEWYNALTSNCTTNIFGHAKPYAQDPHFDWRMLVNGYLDEMMYERGTIDHDLPLTEERARANINPLAQAADGAADFSERIRARLAKTER
jgi:hypothetical protein